MEGVYDLHSQSDGICCPNRGKLKGNFSIKLSLSLQLTPVSSRNAKLILAPPHQLASDLVGGITPLLALASNSCGILGMRPRCNRPTTSRPESTANPIAEIVRENSHKIVFMEFDIFSLQAWITSIHDWCLAERGRACQQLSDRCKLHFQLRVHIDWKYATLLPNSRQRLQVINIVSFFFFSKNRFSK